MSTVDSVGLHNSSSIYDLEFAARSGVSKGRPLPAQASL